MSDDEQERRTTRAERARAIRDELLMRRREREAGPVLLVEVLAPMLTDGSGAPHIPAPESLRRRQITRVCFPPSAHAPPDSPVHPSRGPGLYRSEPRGLVRLPTTGAR